MNERIQELALQAGMKNTSLHYGRKDPYVLWEDDIEKFAELIIEDCIEIVEPCKCGCCHGEPESIISDTIIKQIRDHFGVEQ